MSDQVLWGVSNMVHLTELTYSTCCYAVCCLWRFRRWWPGVGGAVITSDNVLDSTFLMIHTYHCALFVLHELMFLLLRSSWFMCMKWHTCWFAVHSSWCMSWDSRVSGTQQMDQLWAWCKGFICDRVKTRVDGLPNTQLFSQAYQYVWQKNNVDKWIPLKVWGLEAPVLPSFCLGRGAQPWPGLVAWEFAWAWTMNTSRLAAVVFVMAWRASQTWSFQALALHQGWGDPGSTFVGACYRCRQPALWREFWWTWALGPAFMMQVSIGTCQRLTKYFLG